MHLLADHSQLVPAWNKLGKSVDPLVPAAAVTVMVAGLAVAAALDGDGAIVDAHGLAALNHLAGQLQQTLAFLVGEALQHLVGRAILGGQALLDDHDALVGQRYGQLALLASGKAHVAVLLGLLGHANDLVAVPAETLLQLLQRQFPVAELVEHLTHGALSAFEAARAALVHGQLAVIGRHFQLMQNLS